MRSKSKSFIKDDLPVSSDSGSDGSRNAIQQEPLNTSYWSGEYVRTVRTASYNEFWMKAQILSGKAPGGENGSISSPSSSTILSFRLVANSLLEPDQEAVDAMLQDSENWKKPEILELVSDYFDSSLKASSLCGTLLRSIEQARRDCTTMNATLAVISRSGDLDDGRHHQVVERLCDLGEYDNPFSEPASQQFQTVQDCYRKLHTRLEENRGAINKRIKVLKYWRRGSGGLLMAALVGASVCAVLIATHAVAVVAAAPLLAMVPVPIRKRLGSLRLHQMSLLRKHSAQLDAAARGTYTVNRVLDTMTCLVTRLHDEVERNKALIRFAWQHREELASVQEVTKQLTKNQRNIRLQLEELEEHVYLCFMTVNKARSLVVQEISPRSL